MGTPSFAVASLQKLLESRHEVVAVVTRPDSPAGRGLALHAPPVRDLALDRGLPVLQPVKIRTSGFLDEIRSLRPDVLVVVAFGRILTRGILDAAPHGGINVHASLLPKYRGAAPVAWAIASGETVSGVTTMRMVEQLDAGDILLQRSTAILPEETAGELEARLAAMGAEVLVDTLDSLQEGTMAFLPQREEAATLAPILKKEDGRIDWSMSAGRIACRVRAFNPWPVACTIARGRSIRIWKARVASGTGEPRSATSRPGVVTEAGAEGVRVACGEGFLDLVEVQPEGKKRISGSMAASGRYFGAGDALA